MIQQIQNTKAYGQLEPFQQNLIINRKNRLQVEDAIIQARNMGYDTWAASSPMPNAWKAIVEEIYNYEACTSCEKLFDMETMATDSGDNYFCQPCYDVLAPVMQQEYAEMVANGEIVDVCHCSVSIEDLDGHCEMCGKVVE